MPRYTNIEPRYQLVLHFEGQIAHLWVKESDSIEFIYTESREWLGFNVSIYQTIEHRTYDEDWNTIIEEETYKLDPNKLVGDGMNLGYSVTLKRLPDVAPDA